MKIKRYDCQVYPCGWEGSAYVDFEASDSGDFCDFEDVQDAIAIERFFAAVALAGTLTKIGGTMARLFEALGENQ